MADPLTNWSQYLEVAALSDVGMRRANNQDAHAVVMASDVEHWHERGHLFLVADGMGAHAAGELASKLAVDNIPHTYHKLVGMQPPAAIEKAISDANALIHNRGKASIDFQGMGTTCSTLVVLSQGALVGHIGDSRVYRLRNNTLEQLTFDHSLVWEVTASAKAAGTVPGYVPKNVITRSMGPNATAQLDLEGPFPIEADDTFLLCSDGLTGPVKDEEIGVILGCQPVKEAVQTLVDLANLRGGPDNITVIAVRVKRPQIEGTDDASQSSEPEGRRVNRPLWITAVVLLAGSLLLATLGGGKFLASICLLAGLAAGGVAMLEMLDKPRGAAGFAGAPFGKGPYRTYPCQANQEIVQKLAETVGQLREAASREAWTINLERFNSHSSAAESATARKDFVRAVREYSHAIRFMLGELRTARATKP